MINPSSQPTTAQMYAELRIVSSRVRWLRRVCVILACALAALGVALWVLPSGASWGF
jgi:hypothetical protein